MTKRKLYNERGFLNDDAKPFVNDTFVSGLRKVLATADDEHDLRIIGSILSSIVGTEVLDQSLKFKSKK